MDDSSTRSAALLQDEARVRTVYARRGSPARESCFEPGHLFMLQGQSRAVLHALRRAGIAQLAATRVLEVGCGSGRWLREFVQWGAEPANVAGVDVLPDRIARARALAPAGMTMLVSNGGALDFPDASFDIVLQSTVFSSILDPDVQAQVAAEMRRVTRPGGIVVSYDLRVNNPRNRDVRAVTPSRLRSLFPGCELWMRRVTLAPPLARFVAPRSWMTATLLEALSPLRTHLIAVARVPR